MTPNVDALSVSLLSREEYFVRRSLLPGLDPTPRIILGTAGFGGVWGPVADEQSIAALHEAWGNGFLFCDSAPAYGRAEEVVGRALRDWRGPRPVLATKVGYDVWQNRDYSPAALERQFRRGIERLHRHSPDMLAIHDPRDEISDATRHAAADWITRLALRGDIRHAGIGGGGPVVQHEWVKGGGFSYVITYNRLNACVLDALRDAVPQMHQIGVKVLAASPLFMGLLGRKFDEYQKSPPAYLEPEFLQRAAALNRLAQESGWALPELALRFLLSMAQADAVVVGASTQEEWRQTQRAYEAGPLPVDVFEAVVRLSSPLVPRIRDGG